MQPPNPPQIDWQFLRNLAASTHAKRAQRREDMSRDGALIVSADDDGDMSVTVFRSTDARTSQRYASAEFCTIAGGGRAWRTRAALVLLAAALEADNADDPRRATDCHTPGAIRRAPWDPYAEALDELDREKRQTTPQSPALNHYAAFQRWIELTTDPQIDTSDFSVGAELFRLCSELAAGTAPALTPSGDLDTTPGTAQYALSALRAAMPQFSTETQEQIAGLCRRTRGPCFCGYHNSDLMTQPMQSPTPTPPDANAEIAQRNDAFTRATVETFRERWNAHCRRRFNPRLQPAELGEEAARIVAITQAHAQTESWKAFGEHHFRNTLPSHARARFAVQVDDHLTGLPWIGYTLARHLIIHLIRWALFCWLRDQTNAVSAAAYADQCHDRGILFPMEPEPDK